MSVVKTDGASNVSHELATKAFVSVSSTGLAPLRTVSHILVLALYALYICMYL